MKLFIISLALLALQNINVSADTSSTISDLNSRLESIMNEASAMVEEISQKKNELTNEKLASREKVAFEATATDLTSGNETFLNYTEAKQLLEDIPDEDVNKKVHDLIKQGDAEGAEKVVEEFFDEYVKTLEDEEAKEDMMANKDPIIRAINIVIEHEAKESDFEEAGSDVEDDEGPMTPAQAKAIIMSIPDETVKNDVLDKIEQKDVAGAETALDEFFEIYVNSLDDETVKEKLTTETELLLKALHEAIEQWDDIEDEVSEDGEDEDGEDSYDANSEVEFEGVSSQFNEILNTLPDEDIRSSIIERIAEGDIDEAEAQFYNFFSKYVSDMPQGREKEKVSESEAALVDYVSSQFQSLRDARVETEFEEDAKEDARETMREILDDIAENQLLIEEALEKLGGN